jgi:hypothetical protein
MPTATAATTPTPTNARKTCEPFGELEPRQEQPAVGQHHQLQRRDRVVDGRQLGEHREVEEGDQHQRGDVAQQLDVGGRRPLEQPVRRQARDADDDADDQGEDDPDDPRRAGCWRARRAALADRLAGLEVGAEDREPGPLLEEPEVAADALAGSGW